MTPLDWPFQNRRIHSLWFTTTHRLWMCGASVFIYKCHRWQEFTEIPLIFTERIRGIENNDVFVAGDFGLVAHFNGIDWRIYSEAAAGLYYSCDYKKNSFVAVGEHYGPAVILRMCRSREPF